MSNVLYQKWKEAIISGESNIALNGNVKVTLVDTSNYTYSDIHDFYDDIPVGARISTETLDTDKTYTNGTFDAANVTFLTVTGSTAEALVIWIDTTVESSSRLVAYFDSVTGLPVTPNGGDIIISWNESGIFKL